MQFIKDFVKGWHFVFDNKSKSYLRVREKGNVSEDFIKSIQQAITEIEQANLNDESGWCKDYINHLKPEEIAQDLRIVKRNIKPKSRICEYGAAPFVFTKALHLLEYRVTGIDINPERFQNLAKLNLDIKKVDIDKQRMPFPNCFFDALIFNELFEHLRHNLIFTLREAGRILKPNGKLILSTPNLRSFMGIINFLLKGRAYSCANDLYHEWDKIEKIGHMGHVREYTEPEMTAFLREVGFSIDKVIYRGKFSSLYWQTRFLNVLAGIFPSFGARLTFVCKKK